MNRPRAPRPAPRPESSAAVPAALSQRIRGHLDTLYPPGAAEQAHRLLCERIERFVARAGGGGGAGAPAPSFDERDVMVVAYGDMVRAPGEAPLRTLRRFLDTHFGDLISGVHLLPIHPSTSDDGFAVADHARVDPRLGGWADVAAFRPGRELMLDAVVNHVSASHPWVRGWARGEPGCEDVLVDVDPRADLSSVTRPRTTPLLTPVETASGRRHVWTTFSADQLDLNLASPRVLVALTDVLLAQVEAGATRLRLDAVGFLWKELGTSCLHLPQTHEIVRLWRTVIDAVAPGTLLATETNVPHEENLRYFGDGTDQAHLVYQFPLAALVLHAFQRGDARTLRRWLAQQGAPGPQTTFLNLLGGHDGIGLRPVEGILAPQDVDGLVQRVRAHGGGVSRRAHPDGSTSPYELNSLYFDALNDPDGGEPLATQVARFMSAQSILLAAAGIPAIYLHALVGSRNWHAGPATTGRPRTISRGTLDRGELEAELADPHSRRGMVAAAWRARLRARRSRAAFHPSSPQRLVPCEPPAVVIDRTAIDGSDRVLCVHSVSDRPMTVSLDEGSDLPPRARLTGLVGDVAAVTDERGGLALRLPPHGVAWLDVPV